MNAEGFQNCLQAVLTGELEVNESFDPDAIRSVESFGEAGVLTRDAGLVVRMADGVEFQITIVRSR